MNREAEICHYFFFVNELMKEEFVMNRLLKNNEENSKS